MHDVAFSGAFSGLLRQAELVANGQVRSVELTQAALGAIESTRHSLNAFRFVRAEAAMREAAEADSRRARGERAPLLGVPVAIKDDTDIAGLPTTFGCPGHFPVRTADAEIVARLKRAGAVIVGKTNTPEIGQWPFTEGPAFGITRNPWNPEYSPGGSSGGSAAAVASGIVAGALGSDGAGSVRIPAAWTHLVGIKTQRELVPTAPEPELFHGLTVFGPLARTVGDAALLLDVVAGTGSRFRDAAVRRPGSLRVGLSLRPAFTGMKTPLDGQVREAVERIAEVLTELGHQVVRTEPRFGLLGLDFLPRSLTGVTDWVSRVPEPELLDPRTLGNRRTGSWLRPALGLARRVEPYFRRRVGAVFDDVDVLLAPTTATPPPRAGHFLAMPNWRTDREIVAACPYTWPWNVLGWPAVNVPAGFTGGDVAGLPLGAQLMGPSASEDRLIALAAQLEETLRWHEQRP